MTKKEKEESNTHKLTADVLKEDQNTQNVINERLFFFNRTPQDSVQIFEEFPLLRANKDTNSTCKMKMKQKLILFAEKKSPVHYHAPPRDRQTSVSSHRDLFCYCDRLRRSISVQKSEGRET